MRMRSRPYDREEYCWGCPDTDFTKDVNRDSKSFGASARKELRAGNISATVKKGGTAVFGFAQEVQTSSDGGDSYLA